MSHKLSARLRIQHTSTRKRLAGRTFYLRYPPLPRLFVGRTFQYEKGQLTRRGWGRWITRLFLFSLYNPVEHAILPCTIENPPLAVGSLVRFSLQMSHLKNAPNLVTHLVSLGKPLHLFQLQYEFRELGLVEVTAIDDVTDGIAEATKSHASELELITKFAKLSKTRNKAIQRAHAAKRAKVDGGRRINTSG